MEKHADMAIEWNGKEARAGYTDALTNAEYHATKWAVSSSYLKTMLKRGQAAAEIPTVETDSIRLGTAIHTLVLEGLEAFDAAYAVQPEGMDFRTKAGKVWRAEREAAGVTVLSRSDWETANGVFCSVDSDPDARALLKDTPIRERSLFWQDAQSRVWCRARPDAYGFVNGSVVLADLKTCENLDTFERDLFAYGYDVQGAFYLRGLHAVHDEAPKAFHAPEFWLLAVETAKPHRLGLYTVDAFSMALTDELLDALLWQVKASGVQGGNSQLAAKFRRTRLYTGNKGHVTVEMPKCVTNERADYMFDMRQFRMALERRPLGVMHDTEELGALSRDGHVGVQVSEVVVDGGEARGDAGVSPSPAPAAAEPAEDAEVVTEADPGSDAEARRLEAVAAVYEQADADGYEPERLAAAVALASCQRTQLVDDLTGEEASWLLTQMRAVNTEGDEQE